MAEESDFARLVSDLGQVPDTSSKFLLAALEVTARKVKDAWRDRLKGSKYVKYGATSITYDVMGGGTLGRFSLTFSGSEVKAVIGPALGRRQAAIVGILEVGTPTTGPRGFGLAALQENEADFEHGIEVAIDDALKVAGL